MPLMEFITLSEKGLRDTNEDCYSAERIGNYHIFAVADGLGGYEAGEVASYIAIECVKNAMKFCDDDPKSALKDAVYNADEKILAHGDLTPEKCGMATTLIAAAVDDDFNCVIINVGDSRAHIITSDDVKTTKDHSVVNELVDSGTIKAEDAWQHELSNVLCQAIGFPECVMRPDFYEVNIKDTFLLLSSDGLHDYVKKERIQEVVLLNGDNLQKSCDELIQEALIGGSTDNITIVLVHGMS